MKILIPTCGRAGLQHTFNGLPPEIQDQTTLVIRPEELLAHQDFPHHVLPSSAKTIGATRQYIQETFTGKICMVDDDLSFATRRTDDPTRFYPSTEEEIVEMFREIRAALEQWVHVGIALREGANRNTDPHMFNTRLIRVHGMDADDFNKRGIRWDRPGVDTKEDFDVVLQNLRQGHANIVLNDWCQNQKGSNTTGGCATYRDLAKMEEASHKLKEYHPEFVTVVKKKTKTAWGGQERTDVRIQWKQAFLSEDHDEC